MASRFPTVTPVPAPAVPSARTLAASGAVSVDLKQRYFQPSALAEGATSKVSADCVMMISTGLTPSAVKRTMPVRFSVPFSSKEMRTARSPLPPLRSTLSHLLRGSEVHSVFDDTNTSSDPAELETIFSLKLSRMYGFPELPLPESSLLQWLQHSIIVTMAREAVRKERIRFIFICVFCNSD